MKGLVATALVAALLLTAPAGADVLCRGKKQRVFVRAACKTGETTVDLPQGPAGAPGTAAPNPTRVVDATGVQVGLFAEPGREDSVTTVVFEAGTRLVAADVSDAGFRISIAVLFHLATDCSDQPLAFSRAATFVRYAAVLGTTAYYAEDPITTVAPVAYEHIPDPMGCGLHPLLPNGHCCALQAFGASRFGPATATFSITGFTPPFRLEP
ncbi:MAG TPA: hypothetical protein VGR62_03455 [Candidatus Binatia bacterium]|jgi:hypothetical protein|nr:hypothetical protein [Candidatus Binatia bacterium]